MPTFEIVDMFADRGCAGSSLAVVPEAAGLQGAQMRLLARELRQPEAAFVLPPECAGADYRVRVFTPDGESPYGGHSSLGTAATLVRLGALPAGRVVQQCGQRLAQLEVTAGGGRITARNPLPSTKPPAEVLLSTAGLTASALSGPPVLACGFGPLFHFLPVHDSALADARLVDTGGLADVVAFAWNADTSTAYARMFAPGYGMPEDPACASAALGLAVWLVETGAVAGDGSHEFRIRQGLEMDRPSTLECAVTVREGRVTEASVSGVVVPVARGEVAAPEAV